MFADWEQIMSLVEIMVIIVIVVWADR